MANSLLRTFSNITDEAIPSTLPETPTFLIATPSLRGKAATPELFTTVDDFLLRRGGSHPDEIEPDLILWMLQRGVRMYHSRIVHYNDVTDPNSVVGTKATITATTGADSVVFNATEVGTGYNGITINIVEAANAGVGFVDITVSVPELPTPRLPQVIDLPINPTNDQITAANELLVNVEIGSITNQIPVLAAPVALAGGIEDTSLIVDADYTGADIPKTGGVFCFNDIDKGWRLITFQTSQTVKDAFIAAIDVNSSGSAGRKDLAIEFQTDTIDTVQGAVSESTKRTTEAYDSYFATLTISTKCELESVIDSSRFETNTFAPYLVNRYNADKQKGMWANCMDAAYGYLDNVFNLSVDLRSRSREIVKAVDAINLNGLNYVGTRTDENGNRRLGVWGNKNLLQDNTRLLSSKNNADLAIDMVRRFTPISNLYLRGKPNQPPVWRDHATVISVLVKDVYEAGSAIRQGENSQWIIKGDQNITSFEFTDDDLEVNNLTDIQNEIYRWEIYIKPLPIIGQIDSLIRLVLLSTNVGIETDINETS